MADSPLEVLMDTRWSASLAAQKEARERSARYDRLAAAGAPFGDLRRAVAQRARTQYEELAQTLAKGSQRALDRLEARGWDAIEFESRTNPRPWRT